MFDDDIDNPMKGGCSLLSDVLENDVLGDVDYMLPFPVSNIQGSACEENSVLAFARNNGKDRRVFKE